MHLRGLALLAAALVCAALTGCSTLTVESDSARDTDFSKYATWDFRSPSQPPTGDIRADNPFLDRRVRDAIERGLVARGVARKKPPADMAVVYHLAIRQKIHVEQMANNYGYRYGLGWDVGTSTYKTAYDEGTLVLDFVDARTNELIWRGTAKSEIERQWDQEDRKELVDEAIEMLLDRFRERAESGS